MRDRSHAPKNATPIVAKQSPNRKGKPLLPSEWSCAFTELLSDDNQKGYNIPLVKSDPFPYLALFGTMYYNIFFQKNKVVLKKLQILLNFFGTNKRIITLPDEKFLKFQITRYNNTRQMPTSDVRFRHKKFPFRNEKSWGVPLDFLTQNSYVVNRGFNLFSCFCSSDRQGACLESK